VYAAHHASWIRGEVGVEHGYKLSSQDGGREYQKEGREWMLDDLVMKTAERTWEVLKALEYTLKKCVFTTLAIRAFLYPKPRRFLDIEVMYAQNKWLGGTQGRGSRADSDGVGGADTGNVQHFSSRSQLECTLTQRVQT